MSGILPPDVAYKASRAQSQAIAEYLGAGGSADDTSTEGIPLLHLVLSASRRYGLVIGDRLEGAVRAVLDGGPLGAHRLFVDTKFITRSQKEDVLKATKLVADVRAAGGTWTRYLHEPRVRLDVLRKLCCRGRATPQTYFFLGLPWTHMRARRRRQNLVACLFTELPADVFRHAIGFWRSDHDPPYSSNFPFR